MRRGNGSRALRLLALIAPLLTPGLPASAQDEELLEETRPQRTSRQILSSMDESEIDESWYQQIRLTERRGFEYRRPLTFGDHDFEFAIQGPLMKKKTPGLAFEFRF